MKTATIKFKTNGKNYTMTFTWRGSEEFRKTVKSIYRQLKVKKATCQYFTLSTWGFWCGYAI